MNIETIEPITSHGTIVQITGLNMYKLTEL
jgi:hypothetical protein